MRRQKNRKGRICDPATATILAIGLPSILIIAAGQEAQKPKVLEDTERYAVFQPSINFNQGRVRGYDFDKDGQLDKIESASFCYRPTHLAWHDIKRDSSFYSGVQREYSELLNSKDYQRAKEYDKKVRNNWRKLIGR